MIEDDLRNHRIVEDVIACHKEARHCLVLSERTQHVNVLAALLEQQIDSVLILTGGKSDAEAKLQLEKVRQTPADQPLVLCATGKYIGEGFDEARLDTLFLTMPISWHGTLAQYAGRLHRLHENKHEVRIYDYIDHNAAMLEGMYHKRLKGYAALGYQVDTDHDVQGISSDLIYDQHSFQERFLADLCGARRSIVIVSPYVTLRRVRWLHSTLSFSKNKGVDISIITRPFSAFHGQTMRTAQVGIEAIQSLGVTLILREGIHQKHAIIDERVV